MFKSSQNVSNNISVVIFISNRRDGLLSRDRRDLFSFFYWQNRTPFSQNRLNNISFECMFVNCFWFSKRRCPQNAPRSIINKRSLYVIVFFFSTEEIFFKSCFFYPSKSLIIILLYLPVPETVRCSFLSTGRWVVVAIAGDSLVSTLDGNMHSKVVASPQKKDRRKRR